MKINLAEQEQLHAVAGARGVAIALSDLSKSFPGRQVLRSVNLDIAAGEFVAVVGRSGCGKSTLLRLIAGLESATGGNIAVTRGTDAVPKPETRIMFQDARLLPWKKVIDNIALGLPAGTGKATRALQNVGLRDRAGDWPAALSGGQRQRVALARALVHDPELLLLDEPLGALDALTRIEMQQLIETLWQQRGFTALLVTHDVQEAIALADRVILIEDGEIALDVRIELPRPRARGSAAFARLEERILARVLR
ncbi:ATP-binding cassette domain-containing protein [Noviherbaspirillum massiliense]|uniref:ATP-binding cassette domain-containing protein n=1 Tax=Noviherbaspirillum massiliense TaxID=1465823 RepID=UPI0003020771|nr:ATP-binding cassette domain-containing protein [Noviherbaspirillum massiliense]